MKKALVDPRLLQALRPQSPTYTVGNVFRNLQDKMKAIITRMVHSSDDRFSIHLEWMCKTGRR